MFFVPRLRYRRRIRTRP